MPSDRMSDAHAWAMFAAALASRSEPVLQVSTISLVADDYLSEYRRRFPEQAAPKTPLGVTPQEPHVVALFRHRDKPNELRRFLGDTFEDSDDGGKTWPHQFKNPNGKFNRAAILEWAIELDPLTMQPLNEEHPNAK